MTAFESVAQPVAGRGWFMTSQPVDAVSSPSTDLGAGNYAWEETN